MWYDSIFGVGKATGEELEKHGVRSEEELYKKYLSCGGLEVSEEIKQAILNKDDEEMLKFIKPAGRKTGYTRRIIKNLHNRAAHDDHLKIVLSQLKF